MKKHHAAIDFPNLAQDSAIARLMIESERFSKDDLYRAIGASVTHEGFDHRAIPVKSFDLDEFLHRLGI